MDEKLLSHLYKIIAQEATFGIAVFSHSGDCLFINPTAKQLTETEKPSLQDLIPVNGHPQLRSFEVDFLKHEGLYQDLLVKKGSRGSLIANIGIKHIQFESTAAYLLMIQDVTLQKKLQREITQKQNEIKSAYEDLLKQNTQLKELDVAKNRFIALTTHELRTPLSAMVASADILRMGLYDSKEEMDSFIAMIHEQGLQLQELVNDILDFAKIQAGKMDFYLAELDLVPFAQSLFHNFVGMAANNNVSLIFETPATPQMAYFDDVRLRQVVSNIVNNSIKYNKNGGTVRLSFSQTETHIRISVEDTGNGIPKEHAAKVFNEFETVGKVSEHHKGTGLGMPISRKLAEGMGGTLDFTSEPGVGSTFWVEIPRQKIMPEEMYNKRPGSDSGDLAA